MGGLRIGSRFTYNGKEGVILQICNKLPKHHNRENETGPFYGVHYEESNYVWYNEQELIKIINNKYE
tara:strand:+ start:2399 stop:2599 length:201 start_codon:yes stop_codon:yes gene_type:complete